MSNFFYLFFTNAQRVNVIKKSISAQKSFIRLNKEKKIDKALGKLLALVEENEIDEKELIKKLGYELFEDPKIEELNLEIPKNWIVTDVNFETGIVNVTRNGMHCVTIIPSGQDTNFEWFCFDCGNYGPWSGSRCFSCGRFKEKG